MKRIALLVLTFWVSLGLMAAAVFGLGLDPYMDPASWGTGSLAAAAAGVGLLIGDVVLVVPSSIVMVAHGALFGVAGGTALSTLGGMGAAVAGWSLGRVGGRLAARFVPEEDPRIRGYVERHWLLAVILSRPVPILSETVVVVCGATGRPLLPVALAATLGTLPAAAVYAWAGAHARQGESSLLTLGLVLVVAGIAWFIGRMRPAPPPSSSHPTSEPR